MSFIQKINNIFNRKIKIRLIILLVGIIIGALLETVTLSIISPFISILLDSSIVESNAILRYIYKLLGFKSHNTFLAFIAFLLGLIYILRGAYLFTLSKAQYRFLSRRQIELSDRILSIILHRPYLYHVNKNVAEFQRVIIADVNHFMNLILNILLFASDFFMSFFILVFLMITSVPMTLSVIGFSVICVFLYFRFFRSKIKEVGNENRVKNILMSKAVNQALGGIKELKVLQREGYFIKQFKSSGDDYIKSNQRFKVYNAIPRLLIEVICFSGAFVLMGILIITGTNMENIVPQLSLFVLASFRLLPAISRFTGYINQMIFYKTSIDNVYKNLFDKGGDYSRNDEMEMNMEVETEMGYKMATGEGNDIIIRGLTFQYPNTNTAVLEDISLCIPDKKSVAFIGPTGAGKTTLADIILGIYVPQKGNVFYNGKSIFCNFDEWVRQIGYIPQQIYLLDESILENVAFGIAKNDISEGRVWEAVKQAQLKGFIETLPDRLNTIVGDRGVRLSGGQRQRIGIARALYNNPSILILDEATSSLDNETEKAVMDAIESLQGEKTMIVIAHRLSTIENCDVVYRIEDRKVYREK